jgi:hypothetical protein
MSKRLFRKWVVLACCSFGALSAFGCVTDGQFRDFLTTNVIRTVLQTFGSALQAAVVDVSGNT